jgi:hypothetical protein
MWNMAAHKLAKHGLTVDEDHFWNADFPSFVYDVALSEVDLDFCG